MTPHIVAHRLEREFQSAFATFTRRAACLVEIVTGDGMTGWGECLGPVGPNAALVRAMAPLVVGRDPLDIEPIWAALYGAFRDQGQRGLTMTAQSGIDIALWDVAGQHFGVPVHRLLGGAHRLEVPAYATGGFRPVQGDRAEALTAELQAAVAAGFRGVKIKIGYDVDQDAAMIALARDTLGPDVRLMIDANHGYDAVEAAALGNRVAPLGIDWFEEPVVPEQLAAYAELRARQPIPVAGGETWHGRAGFAQAIAARAVDILQPDVCGCGGITEMRKICAMAETAGVRVVPHVWGTGVALAAALQMLAALPPGPLRHTPRPPWLEFDQTPNPLRDELVAHPVRALGGMVAVPERPGLGVEIRRDALERYAVEG